MTTQATATVSFEENDVCAHVRGESPPNLRSVHYFTTRCGRFQRTLDYAGKQ